VPLDRVVLGDCDADCGNGWSPQGCVAPLLAPIERIVHVVSGIAELAWVAQTLFAWEATTSFVVSIGTAGARTFRSMRLQRPPATERPEGTGPRWVGEQPATMHANTDGHGPSATPLTVEDAAPKWPPACDLVAVAARPPMR
jgi:hypothetical protein